MINTQLIAISRHGFVKITFFFSAQRTKSSYETFSNIKPAALGAQLETSERRDGLPPFSRPRRGTGIFQCTEALKLGIYKATES